ncbi:MAG: AtpZ/AtpI family protein [Candidatus Cloacimonetes bacterium]|nr:AtpZ/AtpI family protein [Candidatus Cloacimonadota bacterium]
MLKKNKKLNSVLVKYISLITQLGLTMISSILICLLGAVYLERKIQTDGLIILIGVLIGVAAGIFLSYKLLKKMLENDRI